MSALVSDALARKWAKQLERGEADRCGIPLSLARARVARRVGATPGTLENLHRKRIKGVREWLYSNLLAAVTAQIESEIAALQHEHGKLVALGQGADQRTVEEVEAGVARLRGLLANHTSGGPSR